MRPPILQWKVMLALLAVVIVGASLGSVLQSAGTPVRTFSTSGINQGWTGYQPLHARVEPGIYRLGTETRITPKMFREAEQTLCFTLTREAPPRPRFCRKHRRPNATK